MVLGFQPMTLIFSLADSSVLFPKQTAMQQGLSLLGGLRIGSLLKFPSRKGLKLSKNETSFHVALPHPRSD